MRFTPTPLAGAWLIEIEPHQDPRGFFARLVCRQSFEQQGLNADFVQQSLSWNPLQGTLRGLHFQAPPHAEDKLVRVTQGAIFDVIVDLRAGSASYGQWFGLELSAANRRQLYLPKGFAHGFQTLIANTEISYQMSVPFEPTAARGLRWDDPELKISWPTTAERLVGERDQNLPFLRELPTE